jgi:hypothetical protein
VPEYRKTKTVGVYVRHQARCAAGSSDVARCRCQPSYRGRRWDSSKHGMVWSPTFGDRAEVLSWLAATLKGQEAVDEAKAAGPNSASSRMSGSSVSTRALSAVGAVVRAPATHG